MKKIAGIEIPIHELNSALVAWEVANRRLQDAVRTIHQVNEDGNSTRVVYEPSMEIDSIKIVDEDGHHEIRMYGTEPYSETIEVCYMPNTTNHDWWAESRTLDIMGATRAINQVHGTLRDQNDRLDFEWSEALFSMPTLRGPSVATPNP